MIMSFKIDNSLFKICLLLLIVSVLEIHCGLEEQYQWKQIRYNQLQPDSGDSILFPDEATQNEQQQERISAQSSAFVPYNNVPMGVTHYKGRLFITVPRRNPGIPATLNYILTKSTKGSSPSLRAYPDYATNELPPQNIPNANRIISVYRTRLDVCNRLWFVDTGILEYPNNPIQVQRPSIWVIDLETNQVVRRFEIPASIVQPGNGMASVTVDVDVNDCDNAYAYIPDLLTYHLYTYSMQQNRMWSFSHNFFNFDPMNGDFNVAGLQYQWNDGIFSITLGRPNADGYKTAFFHPMVSLSEFAVSTRILRNETESTKSNHGDDFRLLGERGLNTQSAMHQYDTNTGIMFYSQVATNAVSCWNSAKPYTPQNHGIVDRDDQTMIYPSDLNIDFEGNLWVMTNSMPIFIYSRLDPNIVNFRIWKAKVHKAVRGTVCE